MRLRIKITKEIIEKAVWCGTDNEPDVPENCAVALSLKELFPDVYVTRKAICFKGYKFPFVEIPSEGRMFIEDFDRLCDNPEARLYMDPVSFTIDIPEAVVKEFGADVVKRK